MLERRLGSPRECRAGIPRWSADGVIRILARLISACQRVARDSQIDQLLDRQFASLELGRSDGPDATSITTRSNGMCDASGRSHHRVEGSIERDPFGHVSTDQILRSHLGAEEGASWYEIAAHATDRTPRNEAEEPAAESGLTPEISATALGPSRKEGAECLPPGCGFRPTRPVDP